MDIATLAGQLGIQLTAEAVTTIVNRLDKKEKKDKKKITDQDKITEIKKFGPPNMADVAGGVRMNKNRPKSGKDMIKTTTLGKQGNQGFSKGGSVKTYAKGGGVRKPKMTAGY